MSLTSILTNEFVEKICEAGTNELYRKAVDYSGEPVSIEKQVYDYNVELVKPKK